MLAVHRGSCDRHRPGSRSDNGVAGVSAAMRSLPSGGHVVARWRSTVNAQRRPTGTARVEVHFPSGSTAAGCSCATRMAESRQPWTIESGGASEVSRGNHEHVGSVRPDWVVAKMPASWPVVRITPSPRMWLSADEGRAGADVGPVRRTYGSLDPWAERRLKEMGGALLWADYPRRSLPRQVDSSLG